MHQSVSFPIPCSKFLSLCLKSSLIYLCMIHSILCHFCFVSFCCWSLGSRKFFWWVKVFRACFTVPIRALSLAPLLLRVIWPAKVTFWTGVQNLRGEVVLHYMFHVSSLQGGKHLNNKISWSPVSFFDQDQMLDQSEPKFNLAVGVPRDGFLCFPGMMPQEVPQEQATPCKSS